MNIKYFGEISDITGKTNENVVLDGNTLTDLIAYLQKDYKLSVDDIYVAINHELVQTSQPIQIADTDEIAILSPFAGG